MVLQMTRPWKHPVTGIFYFRKRVPDALRPRIGKTILKRSLGTKEIAAAKLPAVFHSGHSGMGTGMPGGGGLRLKYSNPIHLDDVAVDFPDMKIIIAHPSWPWQDEALSVCLHKPNVYIDLSGWSPKYFPPQLIQYLAPAYS